MKEQHTLIKELVALLEKGNAHVSFEEAVADMPLHLLTVIPEKLPYSIWKLAEHIRIAQWDIIEFCLSEKHVSPQWPEGYWPSAGDKINAKDWEHCLKQIREDRERFISLITDDRRNLFEPFPYGDGQNLFREALLIADHTAYHCGEILVIRRLLGCWA